MLNIIHGDELPRHLSRLGVEEQHALLPRLVKAPALGTAGIGPGGPPRPLQAAVLVDVAQGQIVQAAGGDLLLGDGAVAAAGGRVPVETGQRQPSVLRRLKA